MIKGTVSTIIMNRDVPFREVQSELKAIPFFNLPIILETFLWPSLTFIGELAAAIFCKNNTSGCKENHFYSLPFGQAEASIY